MRGGILLMDHDAVVRQKTTERYLLNELDPQARDEFEEHFFDCQECALDVRAGALFVDESKVILAEEPAPASAGVRGATTVHPLPDKPGWFGWLRPAFAVPVMALLLAVVGYQNLVTYPQLARQLESPQVLPWAQVNVATYGSEAQVIRTHPGESFLLFMRLPEAGYSHYTADLYNQAGKLEWSLTFQAAAGQDQWPVRVPGANREAGNYVLKLHGVTPAGESKEVGQASFELQIQK
jgi:Putative zinc-finger